ncbi:MAG: hypothetical protein M3333_01210, partial [Actinomycetota bacterium]|nr:hypothetical protein [Actinomycetota bacterium]
MSRSGVRLPSPAQKRPPDLDHLEGLREWWRARLEAKNLSPKTIRNYMDAVAQLEAFLASQGLPT